MIRKEEFLKFLKYIGIISERQALKIYKYYQRCYNKRYRIFRFKKYVTFLGYEEGCADTIADYIVYPQHRKEYDNEVAKYGEISWAKELHIKVA